MFRALHNWSTTVRMPMLLIQQNISARNKVCYWLRIFPLGGLRILSERALWLESASGCTLEPVQPQKTAHVPRTCCWPETETWLMDWARKLLYFTSRCSVIVIIFINSSWANYWLNSLAPGGCSCNFNSIIFKPISLNSSRSLAEKLMPQNLIDGKLTLVQVMAWCSQATNHYLSQCWPSSVLSYGVTSPQWVNNATLCWWFQDFQHFCDKDLKTWLILNQHSLNPSI